jgi:DNA-binding NarL/FixJ family response regulator
MNLVIVDDDKLVGISLKTIIESDPDIQVIGMGESGIEAVALFRTLQPDMILMDIRMENGTGLDAGETILKEQPDAKVLFLTTFADDDYIVKTLKIGAKGYLLKQNFESIIPSLKAAYAGQSVFGDDIIAKIPAMLSGKRKTDLSEFGISEKETELIELVAQGLSNKEIAGRLFLSEGTIRNSISVVMEKLGLKRRTQLAIYYYNMI